MITMTHHKVFWFGFILVLSVILGANSKQLTSGQSQQPPPQNQLQTLSYPYGYYLATNYLCYPIQPRPSNVTQPPSLNSSVNFGGSTIVINEVKPGLPTLPYFKISDDNHALVGNIIFYINPIDGHYHLWGVKKNVLPETVDIPSVEMTFYDQTSGRDVASTLDNYSLANVAPGGLQHFDIDTGYNVTRAAKEFKYMYGSISGP
jgi:hypothetical protein